MGQAWAGVIQFILFVLTLIPGIRGVISWYIMIAQAPVWIFLQLNLETELRGAVKIAMWGNLAVVLLAMLQWYKCTTMLSCTMTAARAGITTAIALAMVLSNKHILNMIVYRKQTLGDDTAGGDDDSEDDGDTKKTQ